MLKWEARVPAAAPEMIDFFNIPVWCSASPKAPPVFPNHSQWKHTRICVLTWMLSSTFFHWQKRVNLSLDAVEERENVDLVICLQKRSTRAPILQLRCLTSRWTSGRSCPSSCHRSPLCKASWGQTHKQPIRPSSSPKNHVIGQTMWKYLFCTNRAIELELH